MTLKPKGILNAGLYIGRVDCKGCDKFFYFNFSNLQYSVYRIYVIFVFTWNWWVYSFLSEPRLIIEHMISMAAIWNTGMKQAAPV
jgi:hypothetical protein